MATGMARDECLRFLGVDAYADESTIRQAIEVKRHEGARMRADPEIKVQEEGATLHAKLREVERILSEPLPPQDTLRSQQPAPLDDFSSLPLPFNDLGGGGSLPFVRDIARYYDDHRDQAIEQIVRGVLRRRVQPLASKDVRLEPFAEKVKELFEQSKLPDDRDRLLEAITVLCNPRLSAATLLVDGTPIDTCRISEVRVRPDVAVDYALSLRNGGPRGTAFGYVWCESSTAAITEPAPSWISAIGQPLPVSAFTLTPDGSGDISTLRIHIDAHILESEARPLHIQVPLEFVLQPGTVHQRRITINLPIVVTPIPAIAKPVEAHTVCTVGPVLRGAPIHARFDRSIRNIGEDPLYVTLMAQSSDIEVEPQQFVIPGRGRDRAEFGLAPNIAVTVSTDRMRKGAQIKRDITFRCSGDIETVTLTLVGSLYPSLWQHIRQKQSLPDRALPTLLGGALGALAAFISSQYVLEYRLYVALVCALLAAGSAAWITWKVRRHINGTGVTVSRLAAGAWGRILGITAGIVALIVLLAALAPIPSYAVLLGLLVPIGGGWGVFALERLHIFPRTSEEYELASRRTGDLISTFGPIAIWIAVVAGVIALIVAFWQIILGIIIVIVIIGLLLSSL